MRKIKDIMVHSPKYCSESDTLQSVAKLMAKTNVGCLPVLDRDEAVCGIITDRDICIAVGKDHQGGTSDSPIRDVMSKPVHTCGPEDDLSEALKLMRTQLIARIPVVDQGKRLLGIVTLTNVVKKVYEAGDEAEVSYDGPENILKTLHAIAARNAKEFLIV